jgi:hypothetical protein
MPGWKRGEGLFHQVYESHWDRATRQEDMMMKKTYWISSLLWLLTAAANSIAGNIDDDLRNYLIENRNAFKGSTRLNEKSIDDQYKLLAKSQEIDDNTINLLGDFIGEKKQDNYFCKIKDPQLFSLVFELCGSKKQFSRFGLNMLKYFDPQMVLHQSTAILEWFQNKEISIDLLYALPRDVLELAEFHSLKHEAIKRLDAEMSKNPKGERIYLTRQAKLGDPSAKAKLQSMLEQIAFPDEKSFSTYCMLIRDLLLLEDKDLNIVLVKQFSKNIGAPDYFSELSVRYQIISGFYSQYCRDDFFIKYRPYMIYGRLYDSIPLDHEFFRNGDSIEDFFIEFQKWVKERFGYEMSLEGVDCKICLSHKFNVIPYPKNKNMKLSDYYQAIDAAAMDKNVKNLIHLLDKLDACQEITFGNGYGPTNNASMQIIILDAISRISGEISSFSPTSFSANEQSREREWNDFLGILPDDVDGILRMLKHPNAAVRYLGILKMDKAPYHEKLVK